MCGTGGYKALELSVTETMPAVLSFKIGIKKFYTSLNAAYRSSRVAIYNQIFIGFGIGSVIDINEVFFFNPELVFVNGIGSGFQSYLSFIPFFGYNMTPSMGILLGPSLVWNHGQSDRTAFVNLMGYEFDDNNILFFGGRIALRIQW
ncbi:MAG: hypothetical protein LBB77_10795 [Treponema sp.]|nr:hypothetical protein [Treponema sp.]